jgi:hypothetical protein
MFSEVSDKFEEILKTYQDGEYFQRLLDGKKQYFELTGMLNDDAEDYEHRMSCFNEWFVFNHELPSGEKVFEKYAAKNEMADDLKESFQNINFSIFEYVKVSYKKQIVLKDILHNTKILLPKEHHNIGLFQDDIFISRTIDYKEESHLLRGVRIIPGPVLSILKKESKKIRKKKDQTLDLPFLLTIESLLTKSQQYAHLDPSQIFVF